MRSTLAIIPLALALALGACASPVTVAERGLGLARTVVDQVIKRAEGVNDKVLAQVDRAETLLAEEIVRLQKAKCLLPFTALVRYARQSPVHRQRVRTQCGLDVEPAEATAMSLPE